MKRLLRVALTWHIHRRGAFDSIRGIAEYARRFGPWQILFNQIGDFEARKIADLPDIDGVIVFQDFEHTYWSDVRWPMVPTVSIEHQYSQITPYQVMPDHYATGKLVAEDFLRRGYRRFAYYARRDLESTQPCDVWEREQSAGFCETVRAAGGTLLRPPAVPRVWVRPEHEHPAPDLAAWFRSLPRPVAMMAGSDVRSHHILLAAAATGTRVPEDIAVIGVNNEPWTDIASGGLSSVELDDFRSGYLGAEMLHQLIEGQTIASRIVRVPPRRLIARRSSDALAIDDAEVVTALRYIADHANSRIEVRHVVKATLLSRRTLERHFHNAMNHSIQHHIRLAHLDRAKTLLCDELIPLSRVATMSGFVSFKAMEAMFRRIEKTTPAAHRRKHRQTMHHSRDS